MAIMSETITSHCVYSRPELEIASWMIPSGSSTMMSLMHNELKKETEMCPKMTVSPTKVSKAYKVATGRCTILRHLIQKRPGQVCLSKVPVTQWLRSSSPRPSLVRNCPSLPPRPPPSLPRCACHLTVSTPWSPREPNSTTQQGEYNHPNTEASLHYRHESKKKDIFLNSKSIFKIISETFKNIFLN